nr:glycosyltransferase family 39 protein [Solidesulfovibrio aerotolerans]
MWLAGVPLDAAGRIVSWLAMAGTLYPMYKICGRLFGDNRCFTYCAPLYLLSPIMLFWGRTFMIETFAVFLLAMFLWYCMLAIDTGHFAAYLAAALFATLGMVVKLTTAPPFLVAAGLYALLRLRQRGILRSWRCVLGLGLVMGLALGMTWWWVGFSDHVKLQNTFGQHLSSGSLTSWNFGTLAQRLDPVNWGALLRRLNSSILGGDIWLYVLAAVSVFAARHYRFIAFAAVLLFLLPILVFFNLHRVHNYYQTANAVFILMAGGITYAGLDRSGHGVWARSLLILQLASMVFVFNTGEYAAPLRHPYMRPVNVGHFVREHTPEKTAIVVFGCDWSSEIPYYAQRKSIVASDWMLGKSPQMANTLDRHLGDLPLAAVVTCPRTEKEDPRHPVAAEAITHISNPKAAVIDGCTVTYQDGEAGGQTDAQ